MKSIALLPKIALLMLLVLGSTALTAQTRLTYFEAQGIYGYRSDMDQAIAYNFMARDAMQKPSLGFEWLQRFANSDRDIAIASIQFRMATSTAAKSPFEPQLYNAWLKYKAGIGDISLGHLKPASGLSYSLDNHALILPDMTMYNITYDRDWGALYSKDTTWGNVSLSATNASGMNFYNRDGNYLVAAHTSYGILNEDNYTVGITAQKGVDLVAMGYHFHKSPKDLDKPKLHPQYMAGLDGQFRLNNFESAVDMYAGKFLYKDAYSVLWRNGVNLLPEEKLKLEGQGIWRLFEGKHYVDYSAGFTFKLTPDLAIRAMYDSQDVTHADSYYKLIAQIYYYKQLF